MHRYVPLEGYCSAGVALASKLQFSRGVIDVERFGHTTKLNHFVPFVAFGVDETAFRAQFSF